MSAGLGFLLSVVIVAVALTALGVGLSGLMTVDPAGGLVRTLGGLMGYLVIVALMLVWATRP
jgi:hypothetical protein